MKSASTFNRERAPTVLSDLSGSRVESSRTYFIEFLRRNKNYKLEQAGFGFLEDPPLTKIKQVGKGSVYPLRGSVQVCVGAVYETRPLLAKRRVLHVV